MQKNMNMNMFLISLEVASSAVKLGTVLQQTGIRWSSLDNHAAEGNSAVVSHAQRYRTEIHTGTSFLLTTKDSSQNTTPINMQSMSET